MNTDNLIGRIEVKSSVVGNAPGIKGEKGDTGTGIKSITLNDDYTLTITYTDDNSMTTDSIRGEKGEKGDKGKDGINGKDGAIQYTAGDGVKIENNIISAFTKTSELENDSDFITSSGDTIAEINNKINNIGKIVNFFGDVMGDTSSMGVTCPSICIAKKINSDTWELNFQGQYTYTGTTSNIFVWGYEIAKINALISPLIGKTLKFEEGIQYKAQYRFFTPEGALKVGAMHYGSMFEFVTADGREFLEPGRYYIADGSHGGWPVNYFETAGEFEATIYLKEV